MRLTLPVSTFILAFGATPVWAASVDANINDTSIQAELESGVSSMPNLSINGGILYSEDHDDFDSLVGTLGVQGIETDNATYRAGLGARLYAYDADDFDGSALAFGGFLYRTIPNFQRMSVGAYGWYAPQVTSFGDTEKLYEYGARVAIRAIQNTDVYLGYRYLGVEQEDGGFDDDLDSGLNIGFRMNF
ncbi:hypothetical protein BFW38_15980 [Terasakiispira papahanaumokuakeensis]|uniref:Outer membrane protein beta-barrel domain-containing protein n=1 Tax=Terasakiispira papahanaumokuakeensis TaxID=197479 RepID=A0A1E2VCU2_9GAMM|nr:YfaZ family outer membrane protein [Terasakiispira papahanaumokuakeensis]ODC04807.1 hypothetical protein BFW38_15980 [Terasakiispira papahanaumokuakeensis]